MFTKTTSFKFALGVALAAATVLSHSTSATPASQLEVRVDALALTPSGGDWSNKTATDCESTWDKDHVPEIVRLLQEQGLKGRCSLNDAAAVQVRSCYTRALVQTVCASNMPLSTKEIPLPSHIYSRHIPPFSARRLSPPGRSRTKIPRQLEGPPHSGWLSALWIHDNY